MLNYIQYLCTRLVAGPWSECRDCIVGLSDNVNYFAKDDYADGPLSVDVDLHLSLSMCDLTTTNRMFWHYRAHFAEKWVGSWLHWMHESVVEKKIRLKTCVCNIYKKKGGPIEENAY